MSSLTSILAVLLHPDNVDCDITREQKAVLTYSPGQQPPSPTTLVSRLPLVQ